MPDNTVENFADHLGDLLGALPGVEAVALGGSRAQGTYRPDSDWDVAVYYRGRPRWAAPSGTVWQSAVGRGRRVTIGGSSGSVREVVTSLMPDLRRRVRATR